MQHLAGCNIVPCFWQLVLPSMHTSQDLLDRPHGWQTMCLLLYAVVRIVYDL